MFPIISNARFLAKPSSLRITSSVFAVFCVTSLITDSIIVGISVNFMRLFKNSFTATSLAAFKITQLVPPCLIASRASCKHGNLSASASLKSGTYYENTWK